jgi:hypothetical protein
MESISMLQKKNLNLPTVSSDQQTAMCGLYLVQKLTLGQVC